MGEVLMKILYILGMAATAALAVQDIKYKKINILGAGAVWGMALTVRILMKESMADIIICIVTGMLFIGVSLIAEGVGRGDGYAIGMAMMCLGFSKGIQTICFSFLMLSVVSLVLVVTKKAGKKTSIPYVPWLLAAYAAGGVIL